MKIQPALIRISTVLGARAFQNLTAVAADTATPCKEEPELWFDPAEVREAKRRCMGCELREQCLDFALTQRQSYGVWGGMDEKERAYLHKVMAQTKRRQKEREQRRTEKL